MEYLKEGRRVNGWTNRLLALFMAAVMLVTMLPMLTVYASTAAVTTADVNLRSGAGTSYGVLRVIGTGTQITILETSNGEWYQVQLADGTTGYMSATYIGVSSSGTTQYAAKTTVDVNLRAGPGTGYGVLAVLGTNTSVSVLNTSDSAWHKVRTAGGTEGYISAQYLKAEGEAAPPAVPTPPQSYMAKTTVDVNLRTGPGTNHGVITVLGIGTRLTVIDGSGAWHKVQLASGTQGYITAEYLQKEASAPTPTPVPPVAPVPGDAYTAKTTVDVNLRKGPGTSYNVITLLGTGTKVTVIDDTNNEWHMVQLSSGTQGYVASQYLQKEVVATPTAAPTPVPSTATAKTTADVNLRTGEGTNYSVITVLGTGTTVAVLDTSNSQWYKVQLSNGTTGYISTQYLKTEGTATTPAPGPAKGYEAKTTVDVNLRAGASTSHSVITVLGAGTRITVLDASNAQWHKVQLSSGTQGYIFAQYLKADPTPTPSPAPVTPTPTVSPTPNVSPTPTVSPAPAVAYTAETTVDVNVRGSAGLSAPVITVIGTGVRVTVTDASNSEWHKVKLADGREGYIFSQYLRKVDAAATPTPVPTPPETTITYLKIDAIDGLNLRSEPNTSAAGIMILSNGTVVTLLEKTNNEWNKVRTDSGREGYVYAQYTKPYIPGTAAGSATISATSASVNRYRTLYLSGAVSTGGAVVWSSSNEAVATVNNGFVYGMGEGTATITVQDKYGNAQASCTVTVTGSESLRYAISETSNPAAGAEFNLMAITDMDKSSIRFDISNGQSVGTTSYTTESQSAAGLPTNEVKIFKASVSLPAGSYTVKAYADGSGDYREFPVVVGSDTGASNHKRQASNEIIDIIANFEGFLPTVYPDTLAYNIPTVGYGLVINKNETFYNNLTKAEGFAQLHTSVNKGVYTSAMNNFVSNEGLYLTQAQFDALVSFTYNCGSGWMYNSGLATAIAANFTSPNQQLTWEQQDAIANNLLQWHNAGGKCIYGLLTRRLGEAKLLLYGNYADCYHSSPNYGVNSNGFTYPSCMSKYQ